MQDFTPQQSDVHSQQADGHSTVDRGVEAAIADLMRQAGLDTEDAVAPTDAEGRTSEQAQTGTPESQVFDDAVDRAIKGDDSALQKLIQTLDEETLDRILQEKKPDLSRITFFRSWQSKFDQQIAEERRRRQVLEAELRALREQMELQKKLQETNDLAERERILREYVQKKSQEPVEQAERQLALENLRRWDAYYTNELGIPAETVNSVSIRIIDTLRNRYGSEREIPLDEFHQLRDAAMRALATTVSAPRTTLTQETGTERQSQAPTAHQTQQPPAAQDIHNPDVTVTPGQGLSGDVGLEELWFRGDFETLSRRIAEMSRGR